jgi:hypothetical protein
MTDESFMLHVITVHIGYLQVAKKHRKLTRSDSESGSDGRQSSNFSMLDSDYPYHDKHQNQTPIVADALVVRHKGLYPLNMKRILSSVNRPGCGGLQ